jgi:hypothetical protein
MPLPSANGNRRELSPFSQARPSSLSRFRRGTAIGTRKPPRTRPELASVWGSSCGTGGHARTDSWAEPEGHVFSPSDVLAASR